MQYNDSTSSILFHESFCTSLIPKDFTGVVSDLGGGSGLTKQIWPNVVTVDSDKSKKPDVVGNVLTYGVKHDVAFSRHLLHYLASSDIGRLTEHLWGLGYRSWNVVQFASPTKESQQAKIAVAKECGDLGKVFRTNDELFSLLEVVGSISIVKRRKLTVTSEFYSNQFGKEVKCEPHEEECLSMRVYF